MRTVQTSKIPPEVLGYVKERFGSSPVQVQTYPVWSAARFAATFAAGPPVALTFNAQSQVQAFQYGFNGDMASAGRAGVLAQLADTSLQLAGQTRDQACCLIFGLSACLASDSEGALARRIWREVGLQISTTGSNNIPLGRLEMFPGGGLYGSTQSFALEPDLATPGSVDGGQGATMGFASNGLPDANAFYKFPMPIIWDGLGQGSDTNLSITATMARGFTHTCALARAAAAGVSAYTPPAAAAALGTYVDVIFELKCWSILPRGKNT